MQAFDALYVLAAGDGRGEALFGNCFSPARLAYERSLIGNGYPSAYFEFPLLGEPCFDILSVHGWVEPGAQFAPGAGFGRQPMFDWFEGVCERGCYVSCGLEMDVSDGETEPGKRWRHIADASYSKLVVVEGRPTVLFCAPTFVKLRLRDGAPLDAKVYLHAGMRQTG